MPVRSKQQAQRVGVFVDSQNLFYAAKYTYRARVNFGNILKTAVGDRQLVRAIAYGIKSEEGDEQSFFDALEKQGFDVKVKPLQIFYGGAKKGDWDIGIAMDIMRLAHKLDVVILLSGDGDFVDLLEHANALGCRTEVASFSSSSSHKLREVCDEYYDLDNNDAYLMQKGKVRVQQRRPQSHRSSDNKKNNLPIELSTTKSSSVVEKLAPGVEIRRSSGQTTRTTPNRKSATRTTRKATRPKTPRKTTRRRTTKRTGPKKK